MTDINRRKFLGGALATSGVVTSRIVLPVPLAAAAQTHADSEAEQTREPALQREAIDFRYAPVLQQTAFCFPDDPYKSLVRRNGELLYGYKRDEVAYFPLRITFGLDGMDEAEVVSNALESPGVPIVRTVLQRAEATITLLTFATKNEGEGRVDNVLMEIRPRKAGRVAMAPLIGIESEQEYELRLQPEAVQVVDKRDGSVLMIAKVFDFPTEKSRLKGGFDSAPRVKALELHPSAISNEHPYRVFIRLPQEGQRAEQLTAGAADPEQQIANARKFWQAWSPLQKPVSWEVGGRQGEFLTACARNILQAREVRDGKLTFQVGPTCYRGLWVVDGNFILEAARYLGYDKEAIEGLKTTWTKQQASGQIIAAGGPEHYKDTAIAMFTLVRQCELSQDWSLLHELEPQVVHALEFIESLLARAKAENSALGRYGLLPRGFADGGFDGSREELTNTIWTLAGLKAIAAAGAAQKIPRIAEASDLYQQLSSAFQTAARQEMRDYDGRFRYLPMLLKEDPLWQQSNAWDRPRPQCAQWAMSHTIFPGRVFEAADPVVKGHVALMLAVRQEDIPAETGWEHHDAVWPYNSAFVAEVYLWLGMKQEARDTFVGFLNHATPNYVWREEQSLQQAMVTNYTGDMPHNWASAECIRYLRHSMALEDGDQLRLLAGITDADTRAGTPTVIEGTPTRFGRVGLRLEPLNGKSGWRLAFEREAGPQPTSVSLPSTLGGFHIVQSSQIKVAGKNVAGSSAEVDPALRRWSVTWR
jgi:hypothetical protein